MAEPSGAVAAILAAARSAEPGPAPIATAVLRAAVRSLDLALPADVANQLDALADEIEEANRG